MTKNIEGEKTPCQTCQGDGVIPIGENLVSLDMAIDAGDRSMERMRHSYAYGPCEDCEGTGIKPLTL